jgi:HEPN family protein
MNEEYSLSRNLTKGFSQRVRKNLDFIMDKHNEGEDVHVVSQLVMSLLGITVFPWEAGALHRLEHVRLNELEEKGWPQWNILLDEKGDTETLGNLVRHLRNAASHRRLKFLSDDRELHNVEIEFEDAPNKHSAPNWRARINASDLKLFCDQFTEKLEDLVG